MKKIFLLLPLLLVLFGKVFAQKFGYVDTNYILGKMPEYREAQAEIEQLSKSWQTEIQNMYKEIESMYNNLQAEEVLLTEEMKEERMQEIMAREDSVKTYHNQVFGVEGLFFLKKKELVKPIQERVFEAVQKVSKNHRLQFMFDKAGNLVIIYSDPIHDYTDYVLEELGLGDENDIIK
jgi:outer membrane protein